MHRRLYNPHARPRLRFMTADAGAAGTPGDAPAADASSTPPATDPAPATVEADAAPATAAPAEWDGKVESLPAGAQALIRDLRQENAARRTATKEQMAAVRQVAELVGLELPADDTPPDVATLTEQARAAQAREAQLAEQAREAQVQLAVYRAAGSHHADPAALLDSRSFLASVANLDPGAADFTTKVSAAVKAAVDANAKLRAAQAVGASAVDAGGTGAPRPRTPLDLTSAVSARIAGAR